MVQNVVHIFGASGAGTSTLGRRISSDLGFRFMDTDDYFWLPTDPMYTTKRDVNERLAMMREDIQTAQNVVISGSLVGWGDPLIPLFTLAIRLDTPTDLRIARLKRREAENFGARIAPGGDMFLEHQRFLDWAAAYDTGDLTMRSKAEHDAWQTLLQCPLLTLSGADDLSANLERIRPLLRG